jgi:hypothetical protein
MNKRLVTIKNATACVCIVKFIYNGRRLPAEYENGSVSDVSESWIGHFLVFRTAFLPEFFSMTDSGSGGEAKSSLAIGVFGLFFFK